MTLNNIKRMKNERGFTIVELLIVIVIIGILAAIIIIAYNGITQRASEAAAKENAAGVQKVAEAYNADTNATPTGYPTLASLNSYTGIAKIPAGVTVTGSTPTSSNKANQIGYAAKSTTGACIGYWDQVTNAIGWLYSGNATTATDSSGSITCS